MYVYVFYLTGKNVYVSVMWEDVILDTELMF